MFCTSCGAVNPEDGRFCLSCRAVLPVLGSPPTTPPPWNVAGAAAPRGLSPATTFAGRFEMLSILGKGGMGVVYRARDLELGEEIAIKVLQAQFASDPNEVARFKREILTARKITHPNVIRIHDFGVADGEAFISMEALDGGTLADRIARGVSVEEGVRIAIGIADGLQAAHEKDVIHRDIKPHNVLFDSAGTPKLVDFGIARLATATSRTVGYAGTPHYMSPEQARGADATRLSDVYALGVMMFELFTGSLPFQSDSLVGLAMLHANEAPPAPRSIRRDLPPAIEAVILRALEKDPALRWQGAREVADALRSPQPIAPARLAPPAPFAPPRRAPLPPPAAAKRTSSIAIIAIALVLGLPVAGVLALLSLAGEAQRNRLPDVTTPQTGALAMPGFTPDPRRPLGDCSYAPPAGWVRAEELEEEFFDEGWKATTGTQFVGLRYDEEIDFDDLEDTITSLTEKDGIVLEGAPLRTPTRISASVKSADGSLRGVIIGFLRGDTGVLIAGVAPASEGAAAAVVAERVASSLACEGDRN